MLAKNGRLICLEKRGFPRQYTRALFRFRAKPLNLVMHAQAALLCQVEEKRAKKERELSAKREEDEVERIRVVRALAEERAANRSR